MKESDDARSCIVDSLEQMQNAGVEFFVDGEEVSLKEAARCTVQEEYVYMADYIVGCTGRIEQVYFDKISP